MNQMVFELEYRGRMADDYEHIPLDLIEDRMMDRLYKYGKRMQDYRSPLKYWQEEIRLKIK